MTTTEPETSEGRYACSHCDERFGSVGDKKRHMRDHHNLTKEKKRR